MTAPIDLLVVDDDPFVRRGLADIFAASGDIRVVAEADDGDQVPAALAQHRPHVVLMDLKMQRVGGIEAIATLIAEPDPPRVVAMTALDVDDLVLEAIRAGAHSFIRKDEPPQSFGMAVRAVASGTTLFSEQSLREIVAATGPSATGGRSGPDRSASARAVATLSDREREILRALASGATNAAIAGDLYLSETTVKTHLSHIYTKLCVTTRVEAALEALRGGLVI
ncbi:MAG: response regulator transcription factor [Williamsia herbipolensis]|uniref:Two component transcriptional regulator, LuxR family n=1 Tax=Williamsia serinedens TaxID=391736 RepID=A0ABT1H6G3_9NOCA|nr:response regulator transcription factor [Williamsia serinedens]MBE7160579.1 response regulator transcription factor [Williamsia herbipolensis]MCP2162827.1 two component transcriptional regulator, LuxR family [Williamsia serinedens]